MASQPVLVNFPKKMLSQLDSLVRKGLFSNRSEAIREGARGVILGYGGLAGRAEKPATDVVREIRAEMWKDALAQAEGDERRAADILAKNAKLAASGFWASTPRA